MGVGVAVHGGYGGGSGVVAGPKLLPTDARAGFNGDGSGSGNCADPFPDSSDATNARTASDVKSGIPVKGEVAVGNGCWGIADDDGMDGLADSGVIGGGGAGAGGDGVSTDLAGGCRGGGRDRRVGGGSLGLDATRTPPIAPSTVVASSFSGSDGGCEGVGILPLGADGRPFVVGVGW